MNDPAPPSSAPSPEGVAYALATVGPDGPWWLRRDSALGNPMRTRDASLAWLWPSREALDAWLLRLPEASARQLSDRDLAAVPIRLVAAGPAAPVRLLIVAAPGPAEPDPAAPKFSLQLVG